MQTLPYPHLPPMTTPIRFAERPKSGGSTSKDPTQRLEFFLRGIEDAYIAMAYAKAAVPDSVLTPQGTLWLQDVQTDHEGHNLYGITAMYGEGKREVGSYKFSFDTTGGSVHIKASKQTIQSYPEPVVPFAPPPDFKGLIGVNKDDVTGVDIVVPALKMQYSFKHPRGVMSEAKARYLATITGMTNSVMWHGFQPGELLLLGGTGSDGSDQEAEVNYSMAAAKNATISIGQIAGIVKKGHEVVWLSFEDKEDVGRPVKRAKYAYVERVYDEIDFYASLGF